VGCLPDLEGRVIRPPTARSGRWPRSHERSGFYLRVADIRTAYDLLRSRGIEFVDAPHLIHRHADGTEEWMAHFHDPEGRPLAIMSQVKP